MQQSLPTLSLIIPMYNVEPYIGKCLLSIATQIHQLPGSEVIVVDDGSTDGSREVVKRLAEEHACICLLEVAHQGVGAARERGLEIAKGDYVWFVDSDDWLEKDALKDLRECMTEYPDMDAYVIRLSYYEPAPGCQIRRESFKHVDEVTDGWRHILYGRVMPSARYVFHRSYYKLCGLKFVEGIYNEDVPYGMMLAYQARRLKYLRPPVYAYRQREGSIMHTLSVRNLQDMFTGHRALMEFCDRKVREEHKRAFRIKCAKFLLDMFAYMKELTDMPEFKEVVLAEREYLHQQVTGLLPDYSWIYRLKFRLLLWNPAVACKYCYPMFHQMARPYYGLKTRLQRYVGRK